MSLASALDDKGVRARVKLYEGSEKCAKYENTYEHTFVLVEAVPKQSLPAHLDIGAIRLKWAELLTSHPGASSSKKN